MIVYNLIQNVLSNTFYACYLNKSYKYRQQASGILFRWNIMHRYSILKSLIVSMLQFFLLHFKNNIIAYIVNNIQIGTGIGGIVFTGFFL